MRTYIPYAFNTTLSYYSKHTLFLEQAPCFNFELDADGVVAKGLEVGFITKVGDDLYERNDNYEENTNG
jgi:hypothetical protein